MIEIGPRPTNAFSVHRILLSLAGWRENHSLISTGISEAANADPLFPTELAGSEATACLLAAYAWELSRLWLYTRSAGRHGLYRLRPISYPRTVMNLYHDPRSSSAVAIDLMRESVARSSRSPGPDRLAWMIELGDRPGAPPADGSRASDKARRTSRSVLANAKRLLRSHYLTPADTFDVFDAPRLDDGGVVVTTEAAP